MTIDWSATARRGSGERTTVRLAKSRRTPSSRSETRACDNPEGLRERLLQETFEDPDGSGRPKGCTAGPHHVCEASPCGQVQMKRRAARPELLVGPFPWAAHMQPQRKGRRQPWLYLLRLGVRRCQPVVIKDGHSRDIVNCRQHTTTWKRRQARQAQL